jgi:hypothetical protein
MANGPHSVRLTIYASGTYKFTGGTDGKGNCRNKVGKGKAPVLITLDAPAGYRINAMGAVPRGVKLSGTGQSKMKAHVAGNGQSATITNPCKAKAKVKYVVKVTAPDGSIVSCHPKIVNT